MCLKLNPKTKLRGGGGGATEGGRRQNRETQEPSPPSERAPTSNMAGDPTMAPKTRQAPPDLILTRNWPQAPRRARHRGDPPTVHQTNATSTARSHSRGQELQHQNKNETPGFVLHTLIHGYRRTTRQLATLPVLPPSRLTAAGLLAHTTRPKGHGDQLHLNAVQASHP